MRSSRFAAFYLALAFTLVFTVACATKKAGPDRETVEKALDQGGFHNDVKVDIDRDKGVVTLNGKVRSDELKERAGIVAQQAAPGSIIANQLSVEPVDQASAAKKIEGNIDEAIDHDYKAALIANKLDNAGIHYKVKNGVLTLEGKVKNAQFRQQAESVGASVPNVTQVVNKLEVKGK